jgi:hypothetical protein
VVTRASIPNSPGSSVLPKLKVLTLTLFLHEPTSSYDTGIPEALRQLMHARMEGPSRGYIPDVSVVRLEELRLILQWSIPVETSILFRNLQRWFAKPDDPIAPPSGYDTTVMLFDMWSRSLEEALERLHYQHNLFKQFPLLMLLRRALTFLERQDVSKLDLQTLIVSSISFPRP